MNLRMFLKIDVWFLFHLLPEQKAGLFIVPIPPKECVELCPGNENLNLKPEV
jgi:hypothetical protein